MSILFQPHSDDCVLFSAFNAQRYQPKVITVLRSVKQAAQGIKHSTRAAEDQEAMAILGCKLEQWPEPDSAPDWSAVGAMMRELVVARDEQVFAPAVEEDGHEQHSMIGQLALDIFGDRVISYLTYRRGHGRSVGVEVPFEPWMIAFKLRALSCYQSQMGPKTGTQTWFLDGGLREWVTS